MGGHDTWIPENGKTYAFSINPDDTGQGYALSRENYMGGSTRLLHVALVIKTLLAHLVRPYADYMVFVEVSMPKETIPGHCARVHAHGTIKFKNAGLFYSESQPILSHKCTMKFDELKDASWIDEYCVKCRQLIEHNLSKDTYVIDSKDVLSTAALTTGVSILDRLARKPTARPGGGSRGKR